MTRIVSWGSPCICVHVVREYCVSVLCGSSAKQGERQSVKRAAAVTVLRHAPAPKNADLRPKFDDTAPYCTSSGETACRLFAPAKRMYAMRSASSSCVYLRALGGCFQLLFGDKDATSALAAVCGSGGIFERS